MRKIILLLSLIAGYSFTVYSQYAKPVPNTPDAAAITKVANYPVNLNTGVPGISVPLTQVDAGGGLTIPIELNYHAGGFRIKEQSGTVGLGWNLSPDLQITRTINGIDDLAPNGYINNASMIPYNSESPWTSYSWTPLSQYRIAAGIEDGMPDKFNYKLLNKTGSFYFVKSSGGYYAVPVPFDNIKITFNSNQFIITDVDGTTYYFGRPIQQYNGSNWPYMGYESTGSSVSWDGTCLDCKITSWKCVKVEAANKVNVINFSYAEAPYKNIYSASDRIEYYYNTNPCRGTQQPTIYYPNEFPVTNAGTSYQQLMMNVAGRPYNLSSPRYVEYFNGINRYYHMLWRNPATTQIEDKRFNYDGTQIGGNGGGAGIKGLILTSISFRGGSIQFTGTDRIDAVRVMNAQNGLVRSFLFFYSYTSPVYLTEARNYDGQNFQGTMYLDALHITGSDNTPVEKYAFLYKNKSGFGNHLKGSDAWGYRNEKTVEIAVANANNFPNLTPAQEITHNYFAKFDCVGSPVTFSIGNNTNDEYPNEGLMQNGILKRIVYPTGGFTDFDFEANQYQDEVTSYTGTSRPLLLGGGLRIQKISFFDGKSGTIPAWQKFYVYGNLETGEGILLNRPQIQYVSGKLLYGKNTYTQNIIYSTANGFFAPPWNGYPEMVIPCTSGACVVTQAIEKRVTIMPNSSADLGYAGGSPIYYTKVTEYQLDHGTQTGKTVHEYYPPNEFNGSYVPLVFTNNIPQTNIPYLGVNWHQGALKSVSDYKYVSSRYKLVHQKSYEYTLYQKPEQPRVVYSFMYNLHTLSTDVVNCYIDPAYHLSGPTPLEQDFNIGQYGIPVGKLLITKEIEKNIDDVSNVTLTNTKQYFYDNPNYVQPSRILIESGKGGGAINTIRMNYPYDFSTNPVYADMITRNMIAPVIETITTNNGGAEISRTKNNYFLAPVWGFPTLTSVQKSTNGSALETEMTFDQYDQYGNLLQLTKRGLVTSYLYGYNAKYAIAELQGVPYSSIPGDITSSVVLDNPSSDDQLRTTLNPLHMLPGLTTVNTYTLRPFTGVTSITNKRGQKQFYEYDAYGRLTLMRNNDNKIIKKLEYALTGPSPLALSLFYVNKPIMGTYNNAWCQPYYTDDILSSATPMFRNRVVAGGTFMYPYDYTFADNNAAENMETNTNTNSGCATGYTYATIQLNSFLQPVNPIPSYIYIDLLQNGSVVATYKYPYSASITDKRTVYLPAGEYQVSFRPAPSYRGKILKYWFTPISGGTGSWIETGSTINLSNNTVYNLQATNTF